MHNLPLLITLLTELVLGYIVPTSVSKVRNDTELILPNSTVTSLHPITNTLKNITLIVDKEIYQNSGVKATNVSERSLIYINKRLKTLLKGPTRNNYLAFVPKPGQDIREAIQNGKAFPKPLVPIKQKQQLYNTNAELRTLQAVLKNSEVELKNVQAQSVYRYVYPETPKRNKSCKHKGRLDNQFHIAPINEVEYAEPVKPLEQKYITKTPVKIMDVKINELFKHNNDIINIKPNPSGSDADMEQHSKNMKITSHRHRTPKANGRNCGFLKHHSFHKINYKAGDHEVSPLEDINMEDTGTVYDEGNLDRFIKQALIELKMTQEPNIEHLGDDAEIEKTKNDIHEVNSSLKREISTETYDSREERIKYFKGDDDDNFNAKLNNQQIDY